MDTIIHKREIGKLKIYLRSGDTIKREKIIQAFFPKATSAKLLEEAKKANIRSAHIYRTHGTYEQGGDVVHHHVETGNEGLLVCLELVDEKQNLERFAVAQKELIINKTIIYKAVELWTFDK